MSFAEILDAVDSLEISEKEILLDIISNRLKEQRRNEIISDVKKGRADYLKNNVKRGSSKELISEIMK